MVPFLLSTLPLLPSRDRPITIVAITIQTTTAGWLEIKELRIRRPVFPAAGTPPLQAQPRHDIPARLKSALDMLPGEKRANVSNPALDLRLTVRSVLVFDLDLDAFHGLLPIWAGRHARLTRELYTFRVFCKHMSCLLGRGFRCRLCRFRKQYDKDC